MSWRKYTDFAKRSNALLRVADFLGRGRARIRVLDHIHRPPPVTARPDLRNWQRHDLAALWIGHATTLLRVGGLTILTDPVFSHRVGIGMGVLTAGPMRLVAPAIAIHQVPPVDAILISHAHFDHLDRPSLARFDRNIPIIVADGTDDLVRDLKFKDVRVLRWGESTSIRGVDVIARQVRHWGARTFYDTHRSFNAYEVASGRHRVLYGGDTAYQDYFKELQPVDLAILGIAAYDPYIHAHASPEQAWQMADHLKANFVLPIHHSTFRLSYEPMQEPIERFLDAANGSRDRIAGTNIGDLWVGP